MTRIVAGMNELKRTLGGVRPPRRVLTLSHTYTQNQQPGFLVSEALGNNMRFMHIWVRGVWRAYTGIPYLVLQVKTGTGGNAGYADVQNWQDIVPVRWEGGDGLFAVTPEQAAFDFSMDRPHKGEGRRFAFWGIFTGVGDLTINVSAEVEEF